MRYTERTVSRWGAGGVDGYDSRSTRYTIDPQAQPPAPQLTVRLVAHLVQTQITVQVKISPGLCLPMRYAYALWPRVWGLVA